MSCTLSASVIKVDSLFSSWETLHMHFYSHLLFLLRAQSISTAFYFQKNRSNQLLHTLLFYWLFLLQFFFFVRSVQKKKGITFNLLLYFSEQFMTGHFCPGKHRRSSCIKEVETFFVCLNLISLSVACFWLNRENVKNEKKNSHFVVLQFAEVSLVNSVHNQK